VIEFEVDASAPAKQSGLVEGVLEEAGRINWPPVGQVSSGAYDRRRPSMHACPPRHPLTSVCQ
jgi:hypothetical protein